MNKNKLKDLIAKISGKLVETRRYLHKNPELSFKEYNTMKYICSYLDEIGVEYTANIAGTGVLAVIRGTKNADKGVNILLRADIDALPVCEKNTHSYISQNGGVMHACGHDGHTAILLGACEIINELKGEFSGTVKFAFQPGEETSGGAEPMIKAGVLENPDVDYCMALHMDPDIEVGNVRIKPNSLYASPDDFRIKIIGNGGHAAEPHKCVDVISVCAEIIQTLNTIVSREISPFDDAVVTVGSVHAGTVSNIIPDTAEITGTARSLTSSVRGLLKKRIGEIAEHICKLHNAKCEYEFTELFPPLINDAELSKKIYDLLCAYFGNDECIWGGEATMAGEDFSYFSQKLPSVLVKLGCRNEEKGITKPLHHPSFDIDEECLTQGVELFVISVLGIMG